MHGPYNVKFITILSQFFSSTIINSNSSNNSNSNTTNPVMVNVGNLAFAKFIVCNGMYNGKRAGFVVAV